MNSRRTNNCNYKYTLPKNTWGCIFSQKSSLSPTNHWLGEVGRTNFRFGQRLPLSAFLHSRNLLSIRFLIFRKTERTYIICRMSISAGWNNAEPHFFQFVNNCSTEPLYNCTLQNDTPEYTEYDTYTIHSLCYISIRDLFGLFSSSVYSIYLIFLCSKPTM